MNTKAALTIFDLLKTMHPEAGCELQFSTPFELLVAVILSAQCTDRRVNAVTDKLFLRANTAEQLSAMSSEELKPLIYSCGFFNNKGKNLLAMSQAVHAQYGGEVPADFEKLCELPGVGRKTASVVLSVGFDIPAMPVDTHVNRVSHRIGFSDGKTVERVEEDLKSLFPKENWNDLHHCMIFHGRYICHARKPACDRCLLRENCKYFQEERKG